MHEKSHYISAWMSQLHTNIIKLNTEHCNLTFIKSKGEQINVDIVDPINPAVNLIPGGMFGYFYKFYIYFVSFFIFWRYVHTIFSLSIPFIKNNINFCW